MPVVGEFHTKYWEASDTSAPPPPSTVALRVYQYPFYQSQVVMMASPLGMVAVMAAEVWDRLKSFYQLFGRYVRFSTEDRAVVRRVFTALEHPAYPVAKSAVRKTAVTLGFNRPEAWVELKRSMGQSKGEAENVYRHLNACRMLRMNTLNSTVSNPEANLMVELAYQGFSISQK